MLSYHCPCHRPYHRPSDAIAWGLGSILLITPLVAPLAGALPLQPPGLALGGWRVETKHLRVGYCKRGRGTCRPKRLEEGPHADMVEDTLLDAQ